MVHKRCALVYRAVAALVMLALFPGLSGAAGSDDAPDGQPRPNGALFVERLKTLPDGTLSRRQKAVEQHLRNLGVTYNVYGHQAGVEKVWPFDLLPRIIDSREWAGIERGLRQRIRALNLFIDDMYNRRLIVKDRVVPEDLDPASNTTLEDLTDDNLGEGGVLAYAFTNPLFIDVGGDGWTPPGVANAPCP